jgi:ribonuclease HI
MGIMIYTDGGCSGNPGPGGWAYVIVQCDRPVILAEKWGAEQNTTNNRMELRAVIAALEDFSTLNLPPEEVTVCTDSQYVQKGITAWIHTWKRNGWRTSDKKPVKNQELWQRLDELSAVLLPKWQWVKGHAGNEFNERCDRMTQQATGLAFF